MSGRPSKELQKALHNLDVFSTSRGFSPTFLPHLRVIEGKITFFPLLPLKKGFLLALQFFKRMTSPSFTAHSDELLQIVVRSCDVIKKHATYLHMWEGGSLEQRRFALYAKAAIDRFNAHLDKKPSSSFFRRFWPFLHTQPCVYDQLQKIDLMPFAALHFCFSPPSSTQYDPMKMLAKVAVKAPEKLAAKITHLRESFLPVQAKELFLMKAISLLEKSDLASHEEARLMVKTGKIRTSCDDSGIHILSLALQPRVGRVVEIQGAFMGRIPLPDRFQISIHAENSEKVH